MMGSFDECEEPTNFYLLATALRSFFAIIAGHVLSGEVDRTLSEGTLLSRLFWLARYFNPVNLSWRYYSILAYRLESSNWGEKQLALINFEGHPYKPPIPYFVGERIEEYRVRRLEIAGLLSPQGLLTTIAAYQAILAVQYAIFSAGVAFLPNITMPLAIMGLFRVMVSRWIARRVHVDPYPYPAEAGEVDHGKPNRYASWAWLAVLLSIVTLSFWPNYKASSAFNLPKDLLKLSIQVFYQYASLTELVFHGVLLSYGARALGNRILFFDHWAYKLQTLGFLIMLGAILGLGVADFVKHDFYRSCA